MTLLVLGVGHPDRGDDAAGWLVAARLEGLSRVIARQVSADPAAWLTDPWWDRAHAVVIVDAVVTGAPPGTIHHWTPGTLPRRAVTGGGTHDLGVADTLALAAALGRLPDRLEVMGVEGAVFTVGVPASAPVRRAVGRLARELAARSVGGSPTAPSPHRTEEDARVPG